MYVLKLFFFHSPLLYVESNECDSELHHLVHRLQNIGIRMELEKERITCRESGLGSGCSN